MLFRDRLYLILAGIFIASLVSCNLIFLKFFEWASLGGESLVSRPVHRPHPSNLHERGPLGRGRGTGVW